MRRTTLELIEERSRELEALTEELLAQHSAIRVFRNDPSSGVMVVGMKNSWQKLDQPGLRLQSRILRELDRYEPLVETLLRGAPTKVMADAAKAAKTIRDAIDQSEGTYYGRPEEVLEKVHEALAAQRDYLAALYDSTAGEHVYVPDANAIIWNGDLEEWTFEGSERFTIVLTSTLLGELDELKMPSRGESLREKAESAIRRIKEYTRRGDIDRGVPLKRDRSSVRMTAVEPDFGAAPAWLDSTVRDDRLIAAFFEIVREHPHSPVVLVTRDVNMQNKARHAGIPFVEPPDPPAESAGRSRVRRGPRPDVRILDLVPTGGSADTIGFYATVQNYGTQPMRAAVTAAVDGEPVACRPARLDLLGNTEPSSITIDVPRPTIGDLVPSFNSETTLYGRELELQISVDDERVATETWRETIYDAESNRERYEIQQRVWRFGRGEETEGDLRADAIAALLARNEKQHT